MANYVLDAYAPSEIAEIVEHLENGSLESHMVELYGFANHAQLRRYVDAYKSGDKWRFSLRFYMKELEPVLKGMTLEEAYHYCIKHGYTNHSLRRFTEVTRQLRVPLKYAYKNRLYMFRGQLCNCSEIYAEVKGAFSRRTVYNFCREHGYFDEYEAPEKRRRPDNYDKIVDLAIAYGYSYENLRRMYLDGATFDHLENYLKEAA